MSRTETPLAFYLICSVYAADKNRWSWAAAFLSLAFITRHESIVFMPVY
jgi:Gpi18-like mannosyltransferase